MIFSIDNLLTSEELQYLVNSLAQAEFIDGKTTAGWHAKLVKQNTQLAKESQQAGELQELVKTALHRHPLLQMAIQPKIIHSLLFSRYETGMSYGTHIDNALMGQQQQQFWRADVSFTLFLSSPKTYSGGELTIEAIDGQHNYKLEAGSLLVYPSSSLHRVESVTEGTRLVAVGWIQCLVRDASAREILFDLDTVRRSIFAKEGKTIEFDLLAKTHANLLRKWAE